VNGLAVQSMSLTSLPWLLLSTCSIVKCDHIAFWCKLLNIANTYISYAQTVLIFINIFPLILILLKFSRIGAKSRSLEITKTPSSVQRKKSTDSLKMPHERLSLLVDNPQRRWSINKELKIVQLLYNSWIIMCVDGKRLNACARKRKHMKVSYCCWNFISYFNYLIFVFVNIK